MPRTLTDLTEAEWQMLMILREEAASEGLRSRSSPSRDSGMFASKATSKGHPATVGAMISPVLGKTSSIHD